jgi:CRISPR-associated protein Csb1
MNEESIVNLESYDSWLGADAGPAALVIREHLMPVEGPDGVLFPATFAAGDGFKGGYNIDEFPDGKNVCLIDSVGSQANRIEPLFAQGGYAGLVPQVIVKAGEKRVNLLDAGHRAGDAIVRCSALKQLLQDAFKAALQGNCRPLAEIAPTSLVFGVWDSRDTQAKLPRLVASTIRAFDVRKLTRSAQFVPATNYVDEGLLEEPGDLKDAEGKVKAKHPFAQRGFVHIPASASHGGVVAMHGVRRDAALQLAALRMLSAGQDEDSTKGLRRYILGLALTALTYPPSGYLRQGCNLVIDPGTPREFVEVYGDGRRVKATVTHPVALGYAKLAAKAFGIATDRKIDYGTLPDREVEFDVNAAKEDVAGDGNSKKAQKSRGKSVK